jgi:hypothetical protein
VKKKLKILFFCMIVVGGPARSQTATTAQGSLLPVLLNKTDTIPTLCQKSFNFHGSKSFLAADHYSKQLGFFCRQEIKMDKVLKVPLRFRLGSVEQCNWLEGKRR